MKQVIAENKLVELSYKVIDEKSGEVLTSVEYPIGYVHGMNSVLSSQVTAELGFTANRHEGKIVGLAAYADPGELYERVLEFDPDHRAARRRRPGSPGEGTRATGPPVAGHQ